MFSNPEERAAVELIERCHQAGTPLVIEGFSHGGVVAIAFANRLNALDEPIGVDKLLIVDAAYSVFSGSPWIVPRTVSENVTSTTSWFQRDAGFLTTNVLMSPGNVLRGDNVENVWMWGGGESFGMKYEVAVAPSLLPTAPSLKLRYFLPIFRTFSFIFKERVSDPEALYTTTALNFGLVHEDTPRFTSHQQINEDTFAEVVRVFRR